MCVYLYVYVHVCVHLLAWANNLLQRSRTLIFPLHPSGCRHLLGLPIPLRWLQQKRSPMSFVPKLALRLHPSWLQLRLRTSLYWSCLCLTHVNALPVSSPNVACEVHPSGCLHFALLRLTCPAPRCSEQNCLTRVAGSPKTPRDEQPSASHSCARRFTCPDVLCRLHQSVYGLGPSVRMSH